MTKSDLQDLQQDYKIQINHNMVTLYHATTTENAQNIINSQSMYGKENGLFFSTIPNGQIAGYGKAIVEVSIPYWKLELDDQFNNELHFRIPCKPFIKYSINAKLYKKK